MDEKSTALDETVSAGAFVESPKAGSLLLAMTNWDSYVVGVPKPAAVPSAVSKGVA